MLNLEVRPRWNNKDAGCTESEIDVHLAKFDYRKVFVYNHYTGSRHHDAIYISKDYHPPKAAQEYMDLYELVTQRAKSEDGVLDLALGLVDLVISTEELEDKIRYLRSRIGGS